MVENAASSMSPTTLDVGEATNFRAWWCQEEKFSVPKGYLRLFFRKWVLFLRLKRNLPFSNAYFVARRYSLLQRTIFIVLFLWGCLKTTLRTTRTLLALQRCRSVWRLSPMALRFDYHSSRSQVVTLISYTDNNHRVHRKTRRSPDAHLALSFRRGFQKFL